MWVYSHNGHKVGPVEFEEIVNQIKAGVIVETTPVCLSGEKPCRAGQHPKLHQYFIANKSSFAPEKSVSNSQDQHVAFPVSSEPHPASVSEPAAGSETGIPDFSQMSSSTSSGHKKYKHKQSNSSKNSSDFNLVLIICLVFFVVVGIGIGLFFVINGSDLPGVSNLVSSKTPKTVQFTDDDTMSILRPKAENGNREAQFKLALLKDADDLDAESFKWLKKSAENGYAPAQLYLSWLLIPKDKDDEEVERLLKNAADQKYPSAVAFCYAKGVGFEPDKYKPERILKEAAENGDSIAQLALGVYYYFGGIPGLLDRKYEKDMDKAKYWFRQAAEQGIPEAQETLWKDFGEKKWGRILEQKGVISAKVLIAIEKINEMSYRQNQAEIDEITAWVKQEAENGCPEAQFQLGKFYFYGNYGFPADDIMAHKWITTAAENGHYEAEKFSKNEGFIL